MKNDTTTVCNSGRAPSSPTRSSLAAVANLCGMPLPRARRGPVGNRNPTNGFWHTMCWLPHSLTCRTSAARRANPGSAGTSMNQGASPIRMRIKRRFARLSPNASQTRPGGASSTTAHIYALVPMFGHRTNPNDAMESRRRTTPANSAASSWGRR